MNVYVVRCVIGFPPCQNVRIVAYYPDKVLADQHAHLANCYADEAMILLGSKKSTIDYLPTREKLCRGCIFDSHIELNEILGTPVYDVVEVPQGVLTSNEGN
jgi:hypothetical protein